MNRQKRSDAGARKSLRAVVMQARRRQTTAQTLTKAEPTHMTFSPHNLSAFRSTAFIALGSNLRDPEWQVRQAIREIDEIAETALVKISSLYQTAPVGMIDQPPFVNAVVQIETTLSPHDLLSALTEVEHSHGRVRGEKNGPRTLDLDILLFNEWTIEDERLVTPHPRMHERTFVLVPLLEVAPEVYIPDRGFARLMLATLDASGVRKLDDGQPLAPIANALNSEKQP